ncbi:MAG: histidine kinase dimerization/phosphoacceptor domain -containing protein [Balneolaceae bacterium]|nr:histidine kinase dimerization/phosphoacceptor domain -containing protein [Balneolaceae bacterium]
MNKVGEGGQSVKKYVAVVSVFIISASLLVVLTTFAINMLTATGDLNRLIVRWSQQNSAQDSLIVNYLESRQESFLIYYNNSISSQNHPERVIDELMKDQPRANIVFPAFDPDEIHPNEINGLIRIFTLFSETDQIKHIKQTWSDVKNLQQQKQEVLDSLLKERENTESEQKGLYRYQSINQKIHTQTREMILGNAQILLMLKRYSLWFTVLLGILIVLIGVIYTVRGSKQITQTESLLHERDYLALFPELNQYPVINVSGDGKLGFINQSARKLFPSLKAEGLGHPFLEELKVEFTDLSKKWNSTTIKEIKTDGKYFQQVINFISKEKGIHVHSIDITPLKKEQNKLSESLDEKNVLLAEIHHRVKNNMAVISGLLELQEMLGENTEDALAESRSRIQSMAIVHELLYQSDTFSEIDASQYIDKLATHLQVNFQNIREVYRETLMDDDATININLAVPLGLLSNELAYYMINMLSETENHIDIGLAMKTVEDQYCLQIRAVSKGADDHLKENTSNLRFNLIQKLLKQIDGHLKYPESDQFMIQIVFDSTIKKGSNSALL